MSKRIMKGGDLTSGLMTFFGLVVFIGIFGLGVWVAISYLSKNNDSSTPPDVTSKNKPHPGPHPGPSPAPTPHPNPPHPGPSPAPGPRPPPTPFNAALNLLSATYKPGTREIDVDYIVTSSNQLPRTDTYSVSFLPSSGGIPLSNVPEDDPLTSDVLGLQQTVTISTTGMPSNTTMAGITVTGQIKSSRGTIGSPVTINASYG